MHGGDGRMANIADTAKVDAGGVPGAIREQMVLWAFAATIGLSAFLLFAVQPLFARMVLPKLGGSPSVWAVSMCFFQAVLLAGYCYAHLLNRYLAPAHAVLVHVGVLTFACLALPVALPAAASTAPQGNTYLWLIGVLGAGVGLPFFAVSANAPLLQSWFGRTGHAHANDPYFLYGASNLGSLAALLMYPVVAEPLFGLGQQASLWTAGFLSLGAAILGCGALMMLRANHDVVDRRRRVAASSDAPSPIQRLRWIALSFVPSGLLVAFTTYLTTDIASVPFLWVIPLALFLGTFILVFRDPPLVPVRWLTASLPFQAAGLYLAMIAMSHVPFWLAGCLALSVFLTVALVCHRLLYEQRPAGRRLTEFYLMMSLGGVLGGVFAALLAPQMFTSIFEFPLLVLAGLLVQPKLQWLGRWKRHGLAFAAIAGGGIAVLLLAEALVPYNTVLKGREIALAVACMALFGMFAARRSVLHQAAFLMVMLMATVLPSEDIGVKHAVRSFFGLHRVGQTAAGDVRILVHGTTVHGAQRVKDKDGKPLGAPTPMSYYHPGGPMPRSLGLLDGPRRVGIVGLGAGAIACYARPGDKWRLFEIDPAVVRIARDPSLFTYLSSCLPDAPIVVGDARLTLTAEPAHALDYLLIDAFSSDAIPVHLLTTEALKLYMTRIEEKGLLALHISNRHLDLAPVLAASLAELPGVHAALVRNNQHTGNLDAVSSIVVLMSKDKTKIDKALAWPDAKPLRPTGVAAWTDDYANIVSALWRGMR